MDVFLSVLLVFWNYFEKPHPGLLDSPNDLSTMSSTGGSSEQDEGFSYFYQCQDLMSLHLLNSISVVIIKQIDYSEVIPWCHFP